MNPNHFPPSLDSIRLTKTNRELFMGLTSRHITAGHEGHLHCLCVLISTDQSHHCPLERHQGHTITYRYLTDLELLAPRNPVQADMDDLSDMQGCLLIEVQDPQV